MHEYSRQAPRPRRGERRDASGPRAPPRAVRLRLGCPDQGAYDARYGRRHHDDGVFIPADRIRPRPVGTRLHLEIELADRSLAYRGGAVVAVHVAGGPRPGYLLQLEPPEVEVEVEIEIPAPPAPPAPPPAAHLPARGAPATPIARVTARSHR